MSMTANYTGQGTLENVVSGAKNIGISFFRWMLALDYQGFAEKYKLHRNITGLALLTEGVLYIIPGSQSLISVPTWFVVLYNGSRTYKDYKAKKI